MKAKLWASGVSPRARDRNNECVSTLRAEGLGFWACSLLLSPLPFLWQMAPSLHNGEPNALLAEAFPVFFISSWFSALFLLGTSLFIRFGLNAWLF